jgi:hypothetical protein
MQSQRSFADFFTTPTKGCKLRVNEFNVFKNPQGKYAAYHVVTELDGVEYSVWVRWSLLKALVDECYNLFPEKAKAGAFDFKSLHAWRIGNPHDEGFLAERAVEVQAILRSLVAECGADTPVLRTFLAEAHIGGFQGRRSSVVNILSPKGTAGPIAAADSPPSVTSASSPASVTSAPRTPDVPDTVLRREVRQAVEGLDATPTTLALPSLVGRRELVLVPLLALALALVLLLAWAAAAPPQAPPPQPQSRDLIVVTGNAVGSLIAAALGQGSAALGQGAAVVGPWLAVGVTSNARLAKGAADATARALAEAGAKAGNASRAAAVWAAPRVREVVARAAATTRREVPRATDATGRALAVTAVHTGRATAVTARLATAVSTAAAKAAARALADGAKEAGHATAVVSMATYSASRVAARLAGRAAARALVVSTDVARVAGGAAATGAVVTGRYAAATAVVTGRASAVAVTAAARGSARALAASKGVASVATAAVGARAAAAAGVVGRATDVARTTWRDELRTHCPCPGCPCK